MLKYCQLAIQNENLSKPSSFYSANFSNIPSKFRLKLSTYDQKFWIFSSTYFLELLGFLIFNLMIQLLETSIWNWIYRNFTLFHLLTVKLFSLFHTCSKTFSTLSATKAQWLKKAQSTTKNLKLWVKTSMKSFTWNEWKVWTAHFTTLT